MEVMRNGRLATLVGVAALVATACSPSGSSETGASSGGGNAGRPANTLVMGVWQEQSSFLNAGIVDSQSFAFLLDAPVVEGLLWYRSTDQTGSAKSLSDYWAPDLATEVPTTANGDVKTSGCPTPSAAMCVTWKLQPGVKWHDGSAFTSHDVCDTFQFWYLKYGANPPTPLLFTTGWDQVLDCKEDSATQATVDFRSPYGPYLILGTGVYGMMPAKILDQAFAANGGKGADIGKTSFPVDLSAGSGNAAAFKGNETLDKMIDGTGPYVFKENVKGDHLTLVKNNNYWNKAHQPRLDSIIFKYEADKTAEVNGIKAGDIDMAFDTRPDSLKTLSDAASGGRLKIQTVPNSGAEKIDMNLCGAGDPQKQLCGSSAYTNPFTSDPVIRKAMLMSIDRKTLIADQAGGRAAIPKDSFLYLGAEWVDDPSIPTTPYDAAGAGSLLDQAGYKLDKNNCSFNNVVYRSKNGQCIYVNLGTTSTNQSRVSTEREVADYLGKVGIRVLEPFTPNKPNNDFFGSFANRGSILTHEFDMAMYTVTLNAPAEPDTLYSAYHADCGGSCPDLNQIPSEKNKGQGQNDTGEDNPTLDAALDQARTSLDMTVRARYYVLVEQQLAKDLPELPLYQQINVNPYSRNVQNFLPNDSAWDFNIVDWSCANNQCQAS